MKTPLILMPLVIYLQKTLIYIGGIFSAGIWVGVLGIVLVVIFLIYLGTRVKD